MKCHEMYSIYIIYGCNVSGLTDYKSADRSGDTQVEEFLKLNRVSIRLLYSHVMTIKTAITADWSAETLLMRKTELR